MGLSLSWSTIHKMLAQSKFGFVCPVAWAERREYVAVGYGGHGVFHHHTITKSSEAGAMYRFDPQTIVTFKGHLFACENARAVAKFLQRPLQYLRFQTAPGISPLQQARSLMSSLAPHAEIGSSIPQRLHALQLLTDDMRR